MGSRPQSAALAPIITTAAIAERSLENAMLTNNRTAVQVIVDSLALSNDVSAVYLLTPDAFSEMHRLRSDEVFHFYLGDPMEMLQLRPDGTGEVVMLGTDIVGGMRPQVVVQQLREPHPRAGQGVGNDWLSLPRGRARRDGAIRDQQRARSRACQHDRTGQKRGHIEPEPV